MILLRIKSTCTALMIVFCGMTGFAQQTSAPSSELEKILNPLAAHMDRLKSFYVDMTTSMTVQVGSKSQHDLTRVRLWRTIPDKYYIVAENKIQTLILICDGKQLLLYLPNLKQYSLNPAGPEAQSMLETAGMGGGTSSFLFLPQMRTQFLQTVKDKSAKEFPKETVNGVACRKFMLGAAPNEDYVWVPETGDPLLVRCVSRQDFNSQMSLENDTSFHWIADKHVSESTYAIQAPANAQKVDAMDLATLMQNKAAGQTPASAPRR